MIINEDDYLAHYGTPRRSGRYPWGSGGNTDQSTSTRNQDFLGQYKDMKEQGLSDTEIARGMGISTTQLRARRTIANNERKQALTSQMVRLREAGNSNVGIGQRLGVAESVVRSYLKDYETRKENILIATSNALRELVDKNPDRPLDVGSGVENYLGLSATKLNAAVTLLREEGYTVHDVNIPQVGTGNFTRYKVLCPPGTTRKEAFANRDKIQQLAVKSEDFGESYEGIQPPIGISSSRVAIKYGPQGGSLADGVIYVRPGVKDVSLGKSNYAQVRITVDDSHYLKGMAMYKDDLPDGVDLMFNTNKKDTGNKLDAMKPIESDDPLNPYGATIRDQVYERGPDGKKRVTSVMNIVNEEGSWSDWSNEISTQMLSKQSPVLIKTQLDMTWERRQKEYQELSSLTNPTVKKKLLTAFSDETDSAAVHLDAAGFKRQGWHVILPITNMKPSEIYAPKFKDGERVVLIRYPHGGTFEIPELVVNNNHRGAKKALGVNPKDAVGIHPDVAQRLSGADFDGDTVLVIPNGSRKIRSSPALEQLKGFDPKAAYAPYDGMRTIDGGVYRADTGKVDYGGKLPYPGMKQTQMGIVSNLITDMTIRGAPVSDLARAVKHSMVVIDAEKHGLNWQQSAIDNGISQLQQKYQRQYGAKGASTLISRATATVRIDERKPRAAAKGGPINKETGAREFEPTGRLRRNKDGELVPAQQKTKRLAETSDAHTLSSGTVQERLYADHSNRLKNLANQARLQIVHTPNLKYSSVAAKTYAKEVASLNASLDRAQRNRPLERQAMVIANANIRAKMQANPNMDESTLKKVRSQALTEARLRTGASKLDIKITPEEWHAIQAGAISYSKLNEILNKADLDIVRKLATPRQQNLMTATRISRAQQMFASGATRAEVAAALGVSISTLDQSINVSDVS